VTHVIVQHNFVACNKGTGLWTDEHGVNHQYLNNVAQSNFASGASYEISDQGLFQGNQLSFNGQANAAARAERFECSIAPYLLAENRALGIWLLAQDR
jgi:hypothetical protein